MKKSIVRATKQGALYLTANELLQQEDVKELISKLMKSSLHKKLTKYS